MNTLKTGNIAPDFCLPNQFGDQISLNKILEKQWALVYFYPKALTPGCTVQANGLQSIKDELQQQYNVTILGISPDPVTKLHKFKEKHGLTFDLLSDEYHQVADAFGVWGLKKFMGKEYDGIHRLSFLIDQQKVIKHVFTSFKTKNHHEVVINFLEN